MNVMGAGRDTLSLTLSGVSTLYLQIYIYIYIYLCL